VIRKRIVRRAQGYYVEITQVLQKVSENPGSLEVHHKLEIQ